MTNQEEHTTLIVKSNLKPQCSSLVVYVVILAKGTITVTNAAVADADANNANKEVIFKNLNPFIDCINEINNTQVDNAKDVDIVIPIYNVLE